MTEERFSLTRICKLLTSVGNTLTVLGCLGIVLGVVHVFDLNKNSFCYVFHFSFEKNENF